MESLRTVCTAVRRGEERRERKTNQENRGEEKIEEKGRGEERSYQIDHYVNDILKQRIRCQLSNPS
jgi:hypothetical protein